MAAATRSQTEVYLLGCTVTELTGSKLPSLRMALGYFLHHHLKLHETIRQSSTATIEEIAKFWHKVRIPIRDVQNCHTKLEKAFEEWRLLKKNKGRQSQTQQSKEAEFVSRLDDLFDIAHANALSIISVAEDREFLLAQREKGRRGSMAGTDTKLAAKEKRTVARQEQLLARQHRMNDLQRKQNEKAVLLSSSSSSEEEIQETGQDRYANDEVLVEGCSYRTPAKRKRGRKRIVTPQLAATLDRTKISDRKAMFVISETAKSLGHNVEDLALNRDSIRRQRMKHRLQQSETLKADFQGNVPLVVHWDGKLIPDLTTKEHVDRLPVIVSGKGVSQLLTVAKLASGSGEAQAEAVHTTLEDWDIKSSVRAMCFDTTSSNTGRIAGACVLLEQKLGKELLSLACRHHIMELIIKAVFQVCLGATSSPEVPLFKRFQQYWEFIDRDRYESGMADDTVSKSVQDIRDSIIVFANRYLAESQPRDDYREFLELVVIFLGSVPARGIRFMAPGSMHHARWLSKVIYSLKIWMFRSQFHLTKTEEKGLQDVCVFAARVYLKAWITAPLAASAPYNDFLLLKSLLGYSTINPAISKAASHKFSNHLWYLSPELVGLAFFDRTVTSATKRKMVNAMKNEINTESAQQDHTKRITVDLPTFTEKKFEDFFSAKSFTLFQLMELLHEFLNVDPDMWEAQEDYQQASETVRSMSVVNDHAERGVTLIQELSGIITKDESQLQFLLQTVEQHRQAYPDSKKHTLLELRPSTSSVSSVERH
jgi:hypothetical protein